MHDCSQTPLLPPYLHEFKALLRLSRLGLKTYENLRNDGRFGVTHEWMVEAKLSSCRTINNRSLTRRTCEKRINGFPNYLARIEDDGEEYDLHFVALFSEMPDAIPVMCIHGWPGNFLEFLDVLSTFRKKYTPQGLPYHLIVPSLPGYAFSSTPPLHKDWTISDSARLMHKLMVGLGFESGYAVQGGDIGSYTARSLAAKFDSCKVNFCIMLCLESVAEDSLRLEEREKEGLNRGDEFGKTGTAYAMEHTTRPATIGFVLSSSPLAMIGEKFRDWSDTTPSLDQILEAVTFYWLTETFPRAIYPYRTRYVLHSDPSLYCKRPFGYSWNPKEIAPIAKSWAATTGNLVWFRRHTKGGHFAAMEQPDNMANDIENFLAQVWPVE
ncbi:Alpha/Beta hydrolase protein [Cryomyces antarcticus]